MHQQNKYILIFIFTLFIFISDHISNCQITPNRKGKCVEQKGCKVDVSTEALVFQPDTIKKIQQLFKNRPNTDIKSGQRQKKILYAEYLAKINQNKIIQNSDKNGKRRRLQSNGNQFSEIQEGNYFQVTMYDYVISLRGLTLTIYSVADPKLTKVYSHTYSYDTYYPQALHASNGYFAVVFSEYTSQTTTIIKTYKLQNSVLTELRQYRKRGYYVNSREYNSYAVILIQQYIQTPSIGYYWKISDKGTLNETIFQGSGGNSSSSYVGAYARIFAKIPLASLDNANYRFATYLFCDYAWDFMLSPDLNVFVFSNYYGWDGSTNYYVVTFQTFKFKDQMGKTWGSSRWALYPGVIYSTYQLQEFNGYFRFLTLQAYGQWYTPGSVSAGKVPMSTFNPAQGYIQKNLGIDQKSFNFARWRKGDVFINFYDATIQTYSSELNIVTQIFKTSQMVSILFPYGLINMIGIGYTTDWRQASIVVYQVNNRKLVQKQYLTLLNSNTTQYPYSWTFTGWYSTKYIQIDWKNKRVTLPIFTSENQPDKYGYIQIYVNPLEKCISALPVPNPCPTDQQQSAPLIGHVVKHWDNTPNYDYNSGYSEGITLSTTLGLFGKQILITASYCQLQSRMLVDAHQPLSNSSSIVWYEDLCP